MMISTGVAESGARPLPNRPEAKLPPIPKGTSTMIPLRGTMHSMSEVVTDPPTLCYQDRVSKNVLYQGAFPVQRDLPPLPSQQISSMLPISTATTPLCARHALPLSMSAAHRPL
jgi:hypothetical protein